MKHTRLSFSIAGDIFYAKTNMTESDFCADHENLVFAQSALGLHFRFKNNDFVLDLIRLSACYFDDGI